MHSVDLVPVTGTQYGTGRAYVCEGQGNVARNDLAFRRPLYELLLFQKMLGEPQFMVPASTLANVLGLLSWGAFALSIALGGFGVLERRVAHPAHIGDLLFLAAIAFAAAASLHYA